jgi:hypothetical protein
MIFFASSLFKKRLLNFDEIKISRNLVLKLNAEIGEQTTVYPLVKDSIPYHYAIFKVDLVNYLFDGSAFSQMNEIIPLIRDKLKTDEKDLLTIAQKLKVIET